jgi:outer membrane protein assembly factor BamE (lipoprotein component of BamABCDE complex)
VLNDFLLRQYVPNVVGDAGMVSKSHSVKSQSMVLKGDAMKTSTVLKMACILSASVLLGGCMSAQEHYEQTHGAHEREMTVGIVQGEITKGMSGAQVAEVLGSPNIVTTDAEGREVWIYDKISTDVTYSQSSAGAGLALLFGGRSGGAGGAGLGTGSVSTGAGARSKTQRTLTVVIKFDENKRVRDFAYHASKF